MKSVLMRVVGVLAVLSLVGAACGDGALEETPTASLPINDGTAVPSAAGTCLEGEPDCDDTGGDMGAPPIPLEDVDPGDAVVSGGMTADGGLEVSEALSGGAEGIIAVRGFLFDDGSGARLCEVLAESFPPQCGGAFVPVSNYEEVLGVPLSSNQGVTWTDEHVTFFGELIDGEFVVDPTFTG